MKNLSKYIFYLALFTFIVNLISSLLNLLSLIEVPEEYRLNSGFELLIHLIFAYILYWIWRGNFFAQFLLLLSSIVEVIAYFIIVENYGKTFIYFANSILINSILFLGIACLIITNFVYQGFNWLTKKSNSH